MMLGAISAPHHGRPIFSANGASTEPFFEYVDLRVGLVRFRIKKPNVKLVRTVEMLFCSFWSEQTFFGVNGHFCEMIENSSTIPNKVLHT
jgi:hypothetical protein